jgi:hypothetical protein
MSMVRVIPNSIWSRQFRCTGFDSTDRVYITVDEIRAAMDSAADGKDEYREYIVVGC